MRRITGYAIGLAAAAAILFGLYREHVDIDKGKAYLVRQCKKENLGPHRYLRLDLNGRRKIYIPMSKETSDEEIDQHIAIFEGNIIKPIGPPFSTAKFGRHATYLLDDVYRMNSSTAYSALLKRIDTLGQELKFIEEKTNSAATKEEMQSETVRLRSGLSRLRRLAGELSDHDGDIEHRLSEFEGRLREMENRNPEPPPQPPQKRKIIRDEHGRKWEETGETTSLGWPKYRRAR